MRLKAGGSSFEGGYPRLKDVNARVQRIHVGFKRRNVSLERHDVGFYQRYVSVKLVDRALDTPGRCPTHAVVVEDVDCLLVRATPVTT